VRYWWVNQNQTFAAEVGGGYLWSPKRSKGERYNIFYENMREVSPGDLIFSFSDTYIRAVGIASSHCRECPKPAEFGNVGLNWSVIGWKVDVRFSRLRSAIKPKDRMDQLTPVLPAQYSPIRTTGDGNQAVYLAEIPAAMADVLGTLIGTEFLGLRATAMLVATDQKARSAEYGTETEVWEEHLVHEIESTPDVPETSRLALIQARVGQGLFRERVARIEQCCRVTRVDRPEHLRASHCRPWRDSTNAQRLDGENGFLLTPSVDHLFDRGFISFEDGGALLVSPVAHQASLERMGIESRRKINVGSFTTGQRDYLDYHRKNVFLERQARG
jgi:putative restriction endonuclease